MVGSPPQSISVSLGTGSYDLYFNSASSASCNGSSSPSPCRGGTFNSSASTSYQEVNASPAFYIVYGDQSGAIGPYGTDSIQFGQTVVNDVQFGIGEQLEIPGQYTESTMGLGYPEEEAIYTASGTAPLSPYKNLPGVMVREGMAASRLYSIALGRRDTDTPGSLIFGGIDTARYTGRLATLDVINVTQPYSSVGDETNTTAIRTFITTITDAQYITNNTTVSLWSGGSDGVEAWDSENVAVPVLPETASSIMYLPSEHYDQHIAPRFPFVESESCSCDYANTSDRIQFTFANRTAVAVDVRDLFVPLSDLVTGQQLRYDNGTAMCRFTIGNSSAKADSVDQPYILAGPVLSAMYMVFDMDNNQMSIAQAATDVADSPNIVEVEAGPDGVAKAVASAEKSRMPSATATAGLPSSTVTAADQDPPATSGSVNSGAIAGGVVGGVAALALIGGAVFFLLRRKRKNQMRPKSEMAQDTDGGFGGIHGIRTNNPRFNGDPTLE
ncbi:unnamed protein product [Zymoseptoria tritici ST99CH_3D7]|uniref:Peptidase A1 domain-containing protein n=1 Tax=Zymoseptoria tritici (strain ST99CH_3D7) TaxID=1276538 RepID=A0A1X7RSF3_ZYMT9|nr:unnamed protein product [Zymoseptoria tritici ST99CH_3D7]